MTKKEIKTATSNALIVDYILTNIRLVRNEIYQLGTKQLNTHIKDLESELLKRGVLTENDIRILNG